MSSLVRLAYASSSTSKPASLRDDLSNIVREAQAHNSQHQVYGVLYYGNNCFFQCLEGDKIQVDLLYKKLLSDKRHNNIKLLSYDAIEHINFSQWSMKYVLQDQSIITFFQNQQWEKFNPYALEQHMMRAFLKILLTHAASEPSVHQTAMRLPPDAPTHNSSKKYLLFLIVIVLTAIAMAYVLSDHNTTVMGFFNH